MSRHLFFFVLLALPLVFAPNIVSPAPARMGESFEEGIPGYWSASRPGSLHLDSRHYKHGNQSLRWEWQAGDTIRIDRGLGDIARTGGYGGYYGKATFGVWLYQREPVQEGRLRFEFRRGEQTAAFFDFDLNFTGWRPAYLWFERDFEGTVDPATDNIRLVAPAGSAGGTVFIDAIVYNGILDYRAQHIPGSHAFAPGGRELRDRLFSLPTAESEEEHEGVERLYREVTAHLAGSGRMSETFLDTVAERIAEWGIVEDEHGIRGKPVVFRHVDFFEEAGLVGMSTPAKIADLMLDIARRYHWTDREEVRNRLGKKFALLARHLRDQGLEAGSGFQWAWYPGRPFASALALMREPLREHGLLGWAFDFMDYNYGVSDIFDDATMGNPHMDYFHFDTPHRLYGIVLLENTAEQVRHLRAFSRRLSADILLETGPNGFKPDGSIWHHWGHYFAYAVYCVDTLVHVMKHLSETPFRVTPEAYGRVKEAVLAMRLYANRNHIPLSLHGRHPFNYGRGQTLRPATFATLAQANTYGAPHNIDRDLAAAFLRIEPGAAPGGLFRRHGLEAEPHPNGNRAMNYAGISIHRRDRWLALAKGYSQYVWAAEIYQAQNRFGRYLSHGALEILSAGDPVAFHESGYREEGWDWNRLDGTTVVYLPLEKLNAPHPGTEMARSNQTFVGGLSHRGRNGIFVMVLEGHPSHDPTFRGRKTYFFLDAKIVALGSGIANDDPVHPTHTNLFQKHLPDRALPLWVNGAPVAGFPRRDSLDPGGAVWLIDPQKTGYFLPAGHRVSYARQDQVSRDHTNRRDTEGDFATAWIDHGAAPQGEGYEYVVFPDTTPAAMEAFAAAMALPAGQRPIQVLRRDDRVHALYYPGAETWGYVFFESHTVEDASPVVAADGPCLVMVERMAPGRWSLGFCQPDLSLEENVSRPLRTRLTLAGAWSLEEPAPDEARALAAPDGTTVLEFVTRHGQSVDLVVREHP
jgi:chondroitin-sulfate-ABC endolyase/exolyase